MPAACAVRLREIADMLGVAHNTVRALRLDPPAHRRPLDLSPRRSSWRPVNKTVDRAAVTEGVRTCDSGVQAVRLAAAWHRKINNQSKSRSRSSAKWRR